jgi:hypothetical protein
MFPSICLQMRSNRPKVIPPNLLSLWIIGRYSRRSVVELVRIDLLCVEGCVAVPRVLIVLLVRSASFDEFTPKAGEKEGKNFAPNGIIN